MNNEKLFLDYRSFSYKLAGEWWKKNDYWAYHLMDKDDCNSEALMALHKAANTFSEEAGVKFATYASLLIDHHFTNIWRKWKNDEKLRLLSMPLGKSSNYWASNEYEGQNSYSYQDILCEEKDFLSDVEMHEAFFQFYLQCCEQDRKMIFLLWKDVSVSDCAIELKVSQPFVSHRRKKLLKKYREFVSV